jgi:hypothetical protein
MKADGEVCLGRPVHDYSDAKVIISSDRGKENDISSHEGRVAMRHEDLVIIGRVVGALVIGALIGFERTFHCRPAGFRTHPWFALGPLS